MKAAWQALVIAGLLAVGACSGPTQAQQDDPPAVAPETPPPAAVFGVWASGQDRLSLASDGTYLWEREQTCGLPPCPIDQTSGSFTVKGSALYLATVAGPELVIPFELSSDPRRVTLRHPDGTSWTLPFVE